MNRKIILRVAKDTPQLDIDCLRLAVEELGYKLVGKDELGFGWKEFSFK